MPLRRRLLTLSLLGALLALPGASAWPQPMSEAQLKASYLISFLKYIEWPGNPEALQLCLLGREELSPHLRAYEGRLIDGKPLRLLKITQNEQLAGCQMLYVADAEGDRLTQVSTLVGNRPVVIVSERVEPGRHQGAIALETVGGRIVFDINADAINRAGVRVASPMLRLARQIHGGRR